MQQSHSYIVMNFAPFVKPERLLALALQPYPELFKFSAHPHNYSK